MVLGGRFGYFCFFLFRGGGRGRRHPRRWPGDRFFIKTIGKGGVYMGKMGSICHFPRALPASIWGHCSQVLVLLVFGSPKNGCDNDTFCAVLPNIWVFWDPQTLQNKGKGKMTNRPCFTPPTRGGSEEDAREGEGRQGECLWEGGGGG